MPVKRHWGENVALTIGAVFWVISLTAVAAIIALPDDVIAGSLIPDETIVVILIFPLALVFYRRFKRVRRRMRSPKITADQFPDLHAMLVRASETAKLTGLPAAYISLENPVEPCRADNAMRKSVIVGTDFYAGTRENDAPLAMEFMIAHEVGHAAARHGSFWRNLLSAMILPIPGIGGLLTRSQEYTADRFANLHCPEGGPAALALTVTGKDNFPYVDNDMFVDDAEKPHNFYLWLNNALEMQPMIAWRAHALAVPGDRGRLLWHPTRKTRS